MPKRSRYIRTTQESKALKKLRVDLGLSQREVARDLGVPQTKVAHTENGRAYIREAYVELFLRSLGISWEAWDKLVVKSDADSELRKDCKRLLDRISDDKVRVLYGVLVSF